MLQRGYSGDGCDLASTLCKYNMRKADLFVLSWARVLRVRRGSISSELLMCGEGVRSILLLPLVARCLETIDVCIWRMFVFMSVVVIVWRSEGLFVVYRPLLQIVFFCLGVLKYVVCLCKGCDGCCVFCLYCDAWSCRCSCMGSMNVPSCRCSMFVSCVYPVAVLNAAFCMTCSLLMLVEDERGDHVEEAYSRAGLMTALWVAMNVSFCLPHPVAVIGFIICSGLCACIEML